MSSSTFSFFFWLPFFTFSSHFSFFLTSIGQIISLFLSVGPLYFEILDTSFLSPLKKNHYTSIWFWMTLCQNDYELYFLLLNFPFFTCNFEIIWCKCIELYMLCRKVFICSWISVFFNVLFFMWSQRNLTEPGWNEIKTVFGNVGMSDKG